MKERARRTFSALFFNTLLTFSPALWLAQDLFLPHMRKVPNCNNELRLL